jgi:hypothetical protein
MLNKPIKIKWEIENFFTFNIQGTTTYQGKEIPSLFPTSINFGNWDEYKELLLKQRLASFKEGLSKLEKINALLYDLEEIQDNLKQIKIPSSEARDLHLITLETKSRKKELLVTIIPRMKKMLLEKKAEVQKVQAGEQAINYRLDLEAFSFNYDLDYFYNASNISSQEFVFATIEHFERKERLELFSPIQFLNLLWKQHHFVNENVSKAHSVLQKIKAIPLKPLESHILFGFLLKWFGGYPVSNLNENYNSTLRLIEIEFLGFQGDSFEKEFCERSYAKYSRNLALDEWATKRVRKNALNNDFEQKPAEIKEPEKLNLKASAKHYALAFIFDSIVSGYDYINKTQAEIEAIGAKTNGISSGVTFRKKVTNCKQLDLNNNFQLQNFAGENWQEIVLSLSKDKNELEAYFKTKQI